MLRVRIPTSVKKALDSNERIEKITKDLFLVIMFIASGIKSNIIENIEKKEIFSILVQLFHKFTNNSILYILNFI